MKNLTDEFLDFLDATPDKVYGVGDGQNCAFFMFLKSLGIPVTLVGMKAVWGKDYTKSMDVPADIRPYHGSAFGYDEQTYGQLATRIRAGQQAAMQREVENA